MDLDCTDVAGLIDDDGEHLLKPILVGFVFGLPGSVVFATAAVTLFKSGHNIFAVFFSLLFSENIIFLLMAV